MKTFRLISILFFAIAATIHADDPKAPFTLSIVPTSSGAKGGSICSAKKQPPSFYVVLTNISGHPQPTWETWCSWGYFTISFEFTTSDGKHILVTKRGIDWTKNFPDTFLIPPGEHQVYPIQLDSEWNNLPIFEKASDKPVTLKAVYEVSSTQDITSARQAAKYNVWIGRVESPSYTLILAQDWDR